MNVLRTNMNTKILQKHINKKNERTIILFKIKMNIFFKNAVMNCSL